MRGFPNQRVCERAPVAECNVMLYLYAASRGASSQCKRGIRLWFRDARAAARSVPLMRYARLFCCGVWGKEESWDRSWAK